MSGADCKRHVNLATKGAVTTNLSILIKHNYKATELAANSGINAVWMNLINELGYLLS